MGASPISFSLLQPITVPGQVFPVPLHSAHLLSFSLDGGKACPPFSPYLLRPVLPMEGREFYNMMEPPDAVPKPAGAQGSLTLSLAGPLQMKVEAAAEPPPLCLLCPLLLYPLLFCCLPSLSYPTLLLLPLPSLLLDHFSLPLKLFPHLSPGLLLFTPPSLWGSHFPGLG